MAERPDIRPGFQHGLEKRIAGLRSSGSGDAALQVTVLASMGQLNLRGHADNADFTHAVESALGQPLPLEPNTVSEALHRLFWLGPDEWLLIAGRAQIQDLAQRLEAATQGLHAAINDVSGGQVLLRLCGPQAANVLAAGCTLDLHPSAFPVGRCAQTGLARAAVLLYPLDSPDSFELVVRRSFADYLLNWLHGVAGARGLTVDVE